VAGVVVVVLEGRKEERVGGRGGRKKKRRFLFFFFFTAKKNKTLLRAKPQLKASILLNFLGGIGDEGLLLALVQCNAIGS